MVYIHTNLEFLTILLWRRSCILVFFPCLFARIAHLFLPISPICFYWEYAHVGWIHSHFCWLHAHLCWLFNCSFWLESCPFCWLITQSSFCWFILSIFLYSKHHFSSTLDFHMWTILDWPWHKGFLVKVLHRLQTAKQMQKLWSGTRDGNLRICSTWCGDGSAWDSTYRGAFLGFTDANPFTNYISGFCLDDRRDHILFGDFLVSDHWF